MKKITISPITRLEGNAKIEIFLDKKGDVERAFLQVMELRGFEKFCEGRPAEEMPRFRKVGRGKFYKRAYNKAVRRAAKGTGKEHAVARLTTEIKYAKSR